MLVLLKELGKNPSWPGGREQGDSLPMLVLLKELGKNPSWPGGGSGEGKGDIGKTKGTQLFSIKPLACMT